jgi:putative serine protease PepD
MFDPHPEGQAVDDLGPQPVSQAVGDLASQAESDPVDPWIAASTPAPPPPPPPPFEPPPAPPPARASASATPPGRRRSPVMAGLVALSLVASGFALARASGHRTTVVRAASTNGTTATISTTPKVAVKSDGSTEPVAAVAAALAPSVVQIETGQGLGSGFIYDNAGHVLTAAHVVAGAGKTVTVRLADGTTRTGTVVGSDSSTDVAVVKVDISGTKATAASLALGEALRVGQTAVAIGSPFGLDQTVTSGIVSAVDRAMQTSNGAIDMVQTDAPINPGNSGGPLADLQGRVIGINDQIESSSGSSSGVGFAIPIDTAKAVADRIVAGRPVTFAFLGVQSQDSGQGVVGNGALIVGVESGSPAAKAGMRQGDVITRIGVTNIDNSTTLSARIRAASPGSVLPVTVQRNGASKTLTVTLGSTSST